MSRIVLSDAWLRSQARKFATNPADVDDLIQEGRIGAFKEQFYTTTYPIEYQRKAALHQMQAGARGQWTGRVIGQGRGSVDNTVRLTEDVPDKRAEQAFERVLDESHVDSLLSVLNDQERIVVRLRFGFETGEEQTEDAVAEYLGVSRQRIAKVVANALEKMRGAEQ